MLGSGTKIGEPAVVFASKNTALVSRPTRSGSFAVLPRRLTSIEKDKLKCDHFGEKRHTIDTCWALHGVPDWEKERRRLKKEQLNGKALVVVAPTSMADTTTGHGHLTATPPPTLTAVSSTPTPPPPSNFGKAFHAHDTRNTGWIIDSGATDHMTYNSALFSTTFPPHHDHVLTADNADAPVTEVGFILLTPALPLDKVLLDIQTREIFGRGTKKGGLYYVDDVATSRVLRDALRVRWFVLFVDDCTRMMWLYGMKKKSEGVLHETTCPQTPQQNGVAERKNGQILAAALALLLGASVPNQFWMDDVTYAVYLFNRLPSRVLDFQTPMQVLTHHISAFFMLTLSPKVFGCVTYVLLHQNQRSKLDPCALRCVFLGFSPHQKGYRCYHPATRCLYVSMDVTFIKDEMFFSDTPKHVIQGETSSEGHNWLNLQGGVVLDSLIQREEPTKLVEPAELDTPAKPTTLAEPATPAEPTILTDAPHEASLIVPDQAPMDIPEVSASIHTADNSYVLSPRRNRGVPPNRYLLEGKARYAIAHYVSDHRLSPECKAFVTRMDSIKIPTRVEEAFNDPKWAEAMNIGMEAL
ncbi:uncharacterized protein LOC110749062 [Prunus avium]|uniref:Uncharacterized protein LOC110749062 n=1 Tax=Prunus avium TaxID=42229 RepID=A0A6P5RUK3_PRUAV|nr:uncharacterized protein LOC110749062 [Prunus avium]